MAVQELTNGAKAAYEQVVNGKGHDSNHIPLNDQPLYTRRKLRMVCIGAGFFGLTLAHKIRYEHRLEDDIEFKIYEKNEEVGGTWFENRYPGVACDIPIHGYSFPFEPSPDFSAYYAPGREIQAYIKRTSDKWKLAERAELATKVISATWDHSAGRWNLVVQKKGEEPKEDYCHVLVNGTGFLNKWSWPKINGLWDFKGQLVHTANWKDEVKWDGKRVAVIGNGSSGIQTTAAMAGTSAKLVNYVRNPTWVSMNLVPDAEHQGKNFLYTDEEKKKFREDPTAFFKYRKGLEQFINGTYFLMKHGTPGAEYVAAVCESGMKERLAYDPELAKKMIPTFRPGCRRLTPGDGYLEAFEKEHCTMCWDPIETITETGIQTSEGNEEFDIIVTATGFDTSFVPSFEVKGRDGLTLAEKWGSSDPEAFFSVQIEGMPNYFMFNGPNGNIAHGSMHTAMTFVSEYILKWANKIATEDIKSVDPKKESVDDYNAYTQELLKLTAFSDECRSWYKNGKASGNVTGAYGGSFLHLWECLKNMGGEHFNVTYNSPNRFRFMGNGTAIADMGGIGDMTTYMEKVEETRMKMEKELAQLAISP